MAIVLSNTFTLRNALYLDGVASGLMGTLMMAASDPLSGLFGLPAAALFWVGVAFIPWMVALVLMGRRVPINETLVSIVVEINIAWIVASGALMLGAWLGGWVEMTALGYVFVAGQALAVAIFTELQILARRGK
ncbi:ABC-type multidrug transport system permease subunit [Parvibaculum indicum]|uniref:hypothetical protein n=1 Tax=Parvibaculum indicum TaxID=562969 RepID=UPI001421EA02|nr:hypothetical protein [Parvibaculum indicum]NIJ41844.1 ABC-type multidrug transport system permease subunit [Parvibaculum indicum]